jgi:hypothetical protein
MLLVIRVKVGLLRFNWRSLPYSLWQWPYISITGQRMFRLKLFNVSLGLIGNKLLIVSHFPLFGQKVIAEIYAHSLFLIKFLACNGNLFRLIRVSKGLLLWNSCTHWVRVLYSQMTRPDCRLWFLYRYLLLLLIKKVLDVAWHLAKHWVPLLGLSRCCSFSCVLQRGMYNCVFPVLTQIHDWLLRESETIHKNLMSALVVSIIDEWIWICRIVSCVRLNCI